MKKVTCWIFLFFSISIYSQEICNNAIDDDNDGLVDVNDPDCQCNNATVIPSLIPNPSFEEHNGCPSTYSELHYAQHWVQATDATSDYFNCGYTWGSILDAGLNNYPDGNAAVGALYINDWKEYVGTTLSSPMLAGTTYRLAFKIAAVSVYGDGSSAQEPITGYSPVNVTMFGCANGGNIPLFNTTVSPDIADPTWFELGHTTYSPISQWGDIIIEFTPAVNINAIMIGPPTVLPSDYPSNSDYSYPYFLYDQLLLNKIGFFEPIVLHSQGSFCTNNFTLHLTDSFPGYTYQWYLNGIAIANATGTSLSVPTYHAGDVYSIRGQNSTFCFVSESFDIQTSLPSKPLVNPVSYCQFANSTPLGATGTNLLWYVTPTGGTGSTTAPIPSTAVSGSFSFYVSQSCGLESDRAEIIVTINPLLTPDFPDLETLCYGNEPPILNTVSPNGISGTWTPNQIDNTQSGDYNFEPNGPICGVSKTLHVDIQNPVVFTISGGCNNETYLMEAKPTTGSFNESLTFQWEDPQGNPIGQNLPTINLTHLVASTSETENFPQVYGLTITDNNNCSAFRTFTVDKIYCKIPKGVSPNADGWNESFDLSGLQVKRLEIFNRYGLKVYAKDNYVAEWRGQTDAGKELPDATYYYYIEFENGNPKTGWVYLNK